MQTGAVGVRGARVVVLAVLAMPLPEAEDVVVVVVGRGPEAGVDVAA